MSKSVNFRKQCPKFPKVKMLVLLLTRLVENAECTYYVWKFKDA